MQSSPNKTGFIRRRIVASAGLGMLLVTSGYAIASGWAPFVRDDSASVEFGGTVSVLDNGATSVLANDFDFEGDQMFAVITGQPDQGEVELQYDGTFVYVQTGDFDVDDERDRDEFRYRAFDGTGWSREARVRIDIRAPENNPPYVIDNPPSQEAVANTRFEIRLAGYFDDPDGDALTYSASGMPSSLSINSQSGVLSGTPRDSDVRDNAYPVRVTARDPRGATATLEFNLTIVEEDKADLVISATVDGNPVSVGETAQWEIEIENVGTADLEDGELQVQWLSSSSSLSISAPPECTVSDNETRSPFIQCSLSGLPNGQISVFPIQATQTVDGDYSLVAVAIADDPVPGNNGFVGGGQVTAEFSEGPAQIVDVASDALASGDLDGDGYYDIVAPTGSETLVYLNSGNRTLETPGRSLGENSGGVTAVTLDWNMDGRMDVAVAGAEGADARIYIGDGNGGTGDSISVNVAGLGQVNAAAAADFDSDGDDDLVLAGSGDAVVIVSDGGGGYSSRSLPGQGAIDVAITDLDNDADNDVVVVDSSDRSVRLLINVGDGSDFTSTTLQRGSVAGVTASDVNGDGAVDLLLALDGEDLEPPESKVLVQQSDGSFPPGMAIAASPLNKLITGDIDGDLRTDIVAVNDGGAHQFYRGMSDGTFELQAEQIVSEGMRQGLLLDVNADTSLDLILAGRAAGVLEIHANNGLGRLGLGDRVSPVIELVGPPSLTLASGEEYIEEGATATDDIDGDVTDSIQINGSVNTAVVGSYTLTYVAQDRAGNQDSVVRTVQVGINQGTGGGGGGAVGFAWIIGLFMFVAGLGVRSACRQRRLLGRHTSRQ